MSDEQKPGDPADRAADGAFGGVQSHRAGYGNDKLARLTEWLRAHPTATLASGEGALLLGENDRLRAAAKDSAYHYADARAEINRLRDDLHTQAEWADWANGEIDRQRRILAALREPSANVIESANLALPFAAPMIRAAVAAAEQEVG